ncbi:MAG TPA: hypothetical protein DCW90_02065 [Lachnospiraceae bacterium]|nr:hypothetical protein [Lachnospiraceae bacterium]
MEIIRSNAITVINDTLDSSVDLYLSSNLPNIQIYKEDKESYSPSWEGSPLVITPSIYAKGQQVSVLDSAVQISWSRKLGDGQYEALTKNEIVNNGVLTVNANVLNLEQNSRIAYKCTVLYDNTTTVFQEITFNLLSGNNIGNDGESAKYVTVHANSQVFMKPLGADSFSPKTITLTAELFGGLTGFQWSYLKDSQWVDIPNATKASYVVSANDITSGSVTYRCTSGDRYDIMTISKIQDGSTPIKGVDYFDGLSLFVTYCDTTYEPDIPFGDGTEDPWHTDMTGDVIWMSQKVAKSATDGVWGTPVRIKGYDGKNGVSGTSSYFFIRYSANETGNPMTLLPRANTRYIGVATTTTSSPPSSYKSYTWSLMRGTDGTPGEAGADGQTSYLHIKYSNDGLTFTDNDGEDIGKWIGTYVDFTEEDSLDFSKYSWSKFIGDDGIDGVNAYTIMLSNEFIPIPASSNFKPIDSETYSCEVSVYEGSDKLEQSDYSVEIAPESVMPGECKIQDNTLIIAVDNSVALDSNAGIIKLNIVIGDEAFTKDVKWVAVKDGANGSGTITFRIYSQQGTVFTKDTLNPITLDLFCFDGGVEIDEAKWQWFKMVNGVWEKTWSVMVDEQEIQPVTNTKSLPIYREEVFGSQVYKCEMMYNNVRYTDVVTITDKTDSYFSKIIPIGGNMIRSGEDGIVAYVSVFRGSEEIDSLLGPIADTPPDTGEFYYKTTKKYTHIKYSNNGINFTDNNGYEIGSWYGIYTDERAGDSAEFSDYTWTQITDGMVVPTAKSYTSIVLMQLTNNVWSPATSNPHVYKYEWSSNATVENPSILNKVVYLSNDDISSGSIVQCSIFGVSVCQEFMMDINDPIVGSSEPQNPENGQLWLDTSTSPNILKIFNIESGGWEPVNAETQSRVFTSVPNKPFADGSCYHENDLWIVSESDSGTYTSYPAGTLLVANGSNLSFDTNNWVNKLYYDRRIEDLENYDKQLKTYFDFQTDGLKIGRNIDGVNFYSKITPIDLGFYQGSDKIAYISNNKMYNTELEVQRAASIVSHQYMQDGQIVGSYETTFKIGTFQFLFESNGSLSISKVEHDAPKPYISSMEVNSSFTRIILYVKYWGPSSGSCGYTSTFYSGRIQSDKLTFSSITQSNDKIILNISSTQTAGTYDLQILSGMLVNMGCDSAKYTSSAVPNDAVTLYLQK